jgi:YgiT-type zinc finger domain-containing protein
MSKNTDPCDYYEADLDANERLLTVYRHRGSSHFIFEEVPARVCRQCGERYFSARIVRTMDRLMRSRSRRTTVAGPVIALQPPAKRHSGSPD